MKQGVDAVLKSPARAVQVIPDNSRFSPAQIRWDLKKSNALKNVKYEAYWRDRRFCDIPVNSFGDFEKVYLEVGAGSGDFALEKSRREPTSLFVAVERDRMRGKSLVKRSEREKGGNLSGLRGNIIPAITCGVPSQSLDAIYILYPCPWPKNAHRKNRWYMHPMMAHMVRCLKPGGLMVWASDQRFYVDECAYVSDQIYQLHTLSHGPLTPSPWNDLEWMPQGRTKFERTFLEEGQPCFELIARKPDGYKIPLFQ